MAVIQKNQDFLLNMNLIQSIYQDYDLATTIGKSEHLKNKKLISFLPLYKKFNSYGEFIFDHQWANALNRAGRNYYPKLLTAIPFTPCEGDRILAKTELEKLRLIDAGINKMETEEIES